MDGSLKLKRRKLKDGDQESDAFIIRPFEKADYNTYLKWFEDEKIKDALYDIDKEWLNHILKDKSGTEYVVLDGETRIAVVGLEFPSSDFASYTITNIAVNPKLFRNGIGSQILEILYQKHPLKPSESWVAFVEEKNEIARSFFLKQGWINEDVEDGMIKFRKQ